MSLKDKIVAVLRTVEDPEVRQDVYTLNLVYDINVDEDAGNIDLKFRPTIPNCPIGVQLAIAIKKALLDLPGVKHVDLTVTDFYMAEAANQYLKMMDE